MDARNVEVGRTYLIVYRDPTGSITERLVTVEFTNGTLFAGTCHLRNARRCFIYDRVLGIMAWHLPVSAWRHETFREIETARAWLPILRRNDVEMAYA